MMSVLYHYNQKTVQYNKNWVQYHYNQKTINLNGLFWQSRV